MPRLLQGLGRWRSEIKDASNSKWKKDGCSQVQTEGSWLHPAEPKFILWWPYWQSIMLGTCPFLILLIPNSCSSLKKLLLIDGCHEYQPQKSHLLGVHSVNSSAPFFISRTAKAWSSCLGSLPLHILVVLRNVLGWHCLA